MDYFSDCKKLWKQKLVLILQLEEDCERISIGTELAIRSAGKGDTSDLLVHSVNPYGYSLIQFDRDIRGEWIEVLDNMEKAHKLMTEQVIRTDGIIGKTEVNKLEEHIKRLLARKMEKGDPISQYVAMKLWNEYWGVRGKKGDAYNNFSQMARNLVRPLSSGMEIKAEVNRKLYQDNPIFRWIEPQLDCDSIYPRYTAKIENSISIEWSLLPLKRFYGEHSENLGKVIVECKDCGTIFIADSLKNKYCSQRCKNKAIDENKRKRLSNLNLARQNTLCRDAYQHWYRTIKYAKESGRYTEWQIEELQTAMVGFRRKKNVLAKKYRNNEISIQELQNALIETYIVLDELLREMQTN